MAFGTAEDAARSPTTHLESVDYPVSRDELARVAADSGAPADVINLFKSLPKSEYQSKEEVQRDLAEAARRFAAGQNQEDPLRDRRNIGRDAVEGAPPGRLRHP